MQSCAGQRFARRAKANLLAPVLETTRRRQRERAMERLLEPARATVRHRLPQARSSA